MNKQFWKETANYLYGQLQAERNVLDSTAKLAEAHMAECDKLRAEIVSTNALVVEQSRAIEGLKNQAGDGSLYVLLKVDTDEYNHVFECYAALCYTLESAKNIAQGQQGSLRLRWIQGDVFDYLRASGGDENDGWIIRVVRPI